MIKLINTLHLYTQHSSVTIKFASEAHLLKKINELAKKKVETVAPPGAQNLQNH